MYWWLLMWLIMRNKYHHGQGYLKLPTILTSQSKTVKVTVLFRIGIRIIEFMNLQKCSYKSMLQLYYLDLELNLFPFIGFQSKSWPCNQKLFRSEQLFFCMRKFTSFLSSQFLWFYSHAMNKSMLLFFFRKFSNMNELLRRKTTWSNIAEKLPKTSNLPWFSQQLWVLKHHTRK